MNVYIVVNQSPWGDDRRTDSTWLSFSKAQKRCDALNAPHNRNGGYAWDITTHAVGVIDRYPDGRDANLNSEPVAE